MGENRRLGSMNILVMGAGAIGSLFGGLLSHAGNEVTLVGRASHMEQVKTHGLTIRHADGEVVTKPYGVTHPPQLTGSRFDLILLTVKAYDTRTAARRLQPLLHGETMMVSLQNGLGVEDEILEATGRSDISRALTSCGASIIRPGEVSFNGGGATTIGCYSPEAASAVKVVARILREAGIQAETTPNLQSAVWTKTLVNAAINPLGTLTQTRNGQLLESAGLRNMMIDVVEEGVRVAEATGVTLQSNPVEVMLRTAQATALNENSMLQDIRRRRRTEVDYINGAIVRKARDVAVAAPLNSALTELIKGLETATLERQ
ncbi:MAG: ketopantoate reductase family protein [Candidatus Bathyarchaeia archaeon]